MMESIQLCVDCTGTPEQVVEIIGPILNVRFEIEKRLNGEVLRADVDDVELILIDYQFDEEDKSTFHGFRYYVRIAALSDETMRAYSRKAFETLKRANRFKILLIEDLVDVVDRYDPAE